MFDILYCQRTHILVIMSIDFVSTLEYNGDS
nr:MAG TPA: hypothetical protein [Caudoviricetes sp.]